MRSETRARRAGEIETLALDLIEEHGFDGLSMQAVARAAHASNETLYRWYGDKTGLFEALIRRNTAEVEKALDAAVDPDPLDQLARVGPALLAMLLGPRAVALNRAAVADESGALGRALAREGRDTVAPRIVEVMDRANRKGRLTGEPRDMAETWFSLLIGDLQIRRVSGALAEPHSDYIERRASRALDMLARLFPPG